MPLKALYMTGFTNTKPVLTRSQRLHNLFHGTESAALAVSYNSTTVQVLSLRKVLVLILALHLVLVKIAVGLLASHNKVQHGAETEDVVCLDGDIPTSPLPATGVSAPGLRPRRYTK